MSRTDLIADAFTIVRNGVRAKKEEVLIPYSRLLLEICEILKKREYVENFKEVDLGNFKKIKVYLRYEKKESVLSEIKRISKPGRRVYVPKEDVSSMVRGRGVAIISTSKGILTDKEAKEKGVGGEILGIVW